MRWFWNYSYKALGLGLSRYVPGLLTSPVYMENMYVAFSVLYYFKNKDSPIISCRNMAMFVVMRLFLAKDH